MKLVLALPLDLDGVTILCVRPHASVWVSANVPGRSATAVLLTNKPLTMERASPDTPPKARVVLSAADKLPSSLRNVASDEPSRLLVPVIVVVDAPRSVSCV